MRVLIVDDQPMVVRMLSRVLVARAGMSVHTVSSGEAALGALARERFDAVLTDASMPAMSGRELLAEVQRRHPGVVRVLLAAVPSQADGAGVVHQHWSKPAELDALASGLRRAARVLAVAADPRWRAESGDVDGLPAIPPLVLRLNRVLAERHAGDGAVAAVIESEPAVAAMTLELASLAFFAPTTPVVSVEAAVRRLGVGVVRSLATSSAVFAAFVPPADVLDARALQAESLLTAQLASQLVEPPHAGQAAFASGLLLSVGRLVLASRMPDTYRDVTHAAVASQRPVAELEAERLGITHAELGAYLLEAWRLPEEVVEATAHQDAEVRRPAGRVGVAAAVRVAASLVRGALDPRSASQSAGLDGLLRLVERRRRHEWRALLERLRSGRGPVRRRPRHAVSWPARLRTKTHSIAGMARDITLRGTFIATTEAVLVGEPVQVELWTPREGAVAAAGVVRWSGPSVSHGTQGLGIELDAECPALHTALGRWSREA